MSLSIHDFTNDLATLRVTQAVAKDRLKRLRNGGSTISDEVALKKRYMQQEETLSRLEKYLGFPLAKIPVKTDSVGRWKNDDACHDFDFFMEDIEEPGYVRDKPK